MGVINESIELAEQWQLQSGSAKRLQEKLALIKNRVEPSKKRWFWELLQNASDYNETVSVRLVVTKEKVEFLHNGSPFEINDVLNLISPDSGKDDEEVSKDNKRQKGNIGKFGTGLVSTHILSSVMQVKGLVTHEHKCYKFSLNLNRGCFRDKHELINQMSQVRESFKQMKYEEVSDIQGFQTSFSYELGHALPDVPVVTSNDIDLEYLYSVLPYTLCFMNKVQSVSIEDRRDAVHSYVITRKYHTADSVSFEVVADGVPSEKCFAYFGYNDVSTVFCYENNHVIPFPKGMSKVFCGLPLIGMEDIGLPFILNSLEFEPEPERDGIALSPTSNLRNKSLLADSVLLYRKVLDYVAQNKMLGAYNLTNMTRKYNGTQESNTQFYNVGIAGYKNQLLDHAIIRNSLGEFVPFSQIRIPFGENSKLDEKLYKYASFVAESVLPQSDEYLKWFEATDFSLFKDQEYTYKMLADKIEKAKNVYSFGKPVDEVLVWLKECLAYLKECNKYIFSEMCLLPNQLGDLKQNSELLEDDNLPNELKEIFNQVAESKELNIKSELLNTGFNYLDVVGRAYDVEKLSRRIDDEVAELYSKNNSDVSKIRLPLNRLYTWVSKANISKEKLQSWYKWFYPKRASLVVGMLSDAQREQALVIAQSGKMEALASLASADLTDEEFSMLVANVKKLPAALSLLSDSVDDSTYANLKEGECGEELVYKKLLSLYPKRNGYHVVWASKDNDEPRYDFVVMSNDDVVCYCDAKTTMRGIANADSIPFFMRHSQWEFLQTLDSETPYYIARVFLGSDVMKFIRITMSPK